MNTTDRKKKLRVLVREDKTVLPEVLPDPTAARAVTAGPRQRTIAHMQRLLAGAAAMGATVACGKEPTPVTVPLVPDDGRSTTNAHDASVSPPTTATVEPSATVSAQPRPPVTPTGYAVVDPLPPPAHCPGIAQLVNATATFVMKDGMALATVHFPLPSGRPDYKYVKDAQAVSYSGTVVKSEVKADGVTATVKFDPAQMPSITVSVKGTCNQGPGTLSAHITWTPPLRAGTKPKISISEY